LIKINTNLALPACVLTGNFVFYQFMPLGSKAGELAALFTAFFWTFSALSFESASKRVGSMPVNLLRLLIGFIFLSAFCWISRGRFLPVDASSHAWLWLSLSGLIGFAFGDLFLFRAFVVLGSRISMLMMALVPPLTALLGHLVLGEFLTLKSWTGMMLTIGGIAIVVLKRNAGERQIRISHPISGLGYAFGGAVGQAVGLIFSKIGMGRYNAFASSQIRVLAGIAGFTALFFLRDSWPRVFSAFRDKKAIFQLSIGAFFGPFLGVSFSLLAVKNTTAGVASTIMAIVPVLIIPPAVIFFKEKVNAREILGAVIAVIGVGILFLS
jgi:drug/metabolite transporter (DMT)-like permease